jgi:hypothetical protein
MILKGTETDCPTVRAVPLAFMKGALLCRVIVDSFGKECDWSCRMTANHKRTREMFAA